MKSIKFANGKAFEIIECYDNGQRYIDGQTRTCREIVISEDVISLDELKVLLKNPANLSVIEVYMNEDREIDGELVHFEDTEVLENYIYGGIRDDGNGEVWFTVGQKTALELENEEAKKAIDELLIAMEV